jgi:hypothetical protein
MLSSVIAILLASRTAGMWFSVAICAGILFAVCGAAGLVEGSGIGCDSWTFLSKICDEEAEEMRVDEEVGENWRECGGGEDGENDLIGDVGEEGCDNGGEIGLTPTDDVEIGAGTGEVMLFLSVGFNIGLVLCESGGEIVPAPSLLLSSLMRRALPPGEVSRDICPTRFICSRFMKESIASLEYGFGGVIS